jgi:hypothetical protein
MASSRARAARARNSDALALRQHTDSVPLLTQGLWILGSAFGRPGMTEEVIPRIPNSFLADGRFSSSTFLLGQLSLVHPVPVKGRFREGHEAVRDATGPSRLSRSSRGTKTSCVQIRRVTHGSRGRTGQGSSNAVTLPAFSQAAGESGDAGSCNPLIRRVRSAGVKATVHRCDSLLMCVHLSRIRLRAATTPKRSARPFRGRVEQRFGVTGDKEKPAKCNG